MKLKNRFRTLSARSFFLLSALSVYAFVLLCFFFNLFFSMPEIELSPYAAWVALFAGLFVLLVLFYYRFVYVPFKAAAKLMRAFNAGHGIEPLFLIKHPLSPEMIDMIDRIQSLTKTHYKTAELKKQAEYLALQSQINPHFLYNTLEAIRGDALNAGVGSIAEITEALATFFRYTISMNEILVTLEDELTNVQNYFTIQQYRFGDRLALSIDYDGNPADYKLPKMTLQPIIENAIYHGIERKRGPGAIKIVIETTKTRLIMNVIDNGVGIEETKLNDLNGKLNTPPSNKPADKREKGGIALINVNNRIKLLFGELYGIRISSTVDIGTDIEIILPLKN
ncbi:MAG: sensor histidine kinase [Clostridiales bacterium]|jgi:two-component system sensor histidine kinase YesM|nr:sensor histidine kinase [Clostridiales bacterium]